MRSLYRLFLLISLILPGSAQAECADSTGSGEWATTNPDWPFLPYDCGLAESGNVAFSWPSAGQVQQDYLLHLSGPGEARRTIRVQGNWYLQLEPLPPGGYTWHIEKADGTLSHKRSFKVTGNNLSRLIPNFESVTARLRKRQRPRSLPEGASLAKLREMMQTERHKELAALTQKVKASVGIPLPDPRTITMPSGAITMDKAQAMSRLRTLTQRVQNGLMEKTYVAYFTGDVAMIKDAISELVIVAGWPAEGVTSHRTQDQANRSIAWTLAVGYDLLGSKMSEAERITVRESALTRAAQIASDLLQPASRLEIAPYDPHGWTNFHFLSAIAALFVGESCQADEWFARTFPLIVAHGSVWNSIDGGYGNGSYYYQVSLALLIPLWDSLSNASGVDLYQTGWLRAMGRLMPHLYPPGSNRSAFGDGAEIEPAKWLALALSRRVASPLLIWYVQQIGPELVPRLPLLLSPVRTTGETRQINLDTGNRYGQLFRSSGVAVLHQDLAAPNSYTILFRSGGFGSYNHNHADQNSFNIQKRAIPVFIDSGKYDFYGSRHWTEWYKQTKAHNGITYDDGKGQLHNTLAAHGELKEATLGKPMDTVRGEAAQAYGDPISRALRTLIYIRKLDVLLIRDQLEAQRQVVWEWNLHTAERLITGPTGDAVLPLADGGTVCISQLHGAHMQRHMVIDEVPPTGGRESSEYHWRWKANAPSATADLLFAIHLSCERGRAEPKLLRKLQSGAIEIEVEGAVVTVN